MKIKAILRENIKAKRKKIGLTQAELAEAIDVSVPTIQYAERDSDDWPSLATLQKLAAFFKCEEHELFQAPQEEKPAPKEEKITIESLKALIESEEKKAIPASHIPQAFLDLAKQLPVDHKNWNSLFNKLKFEIEEYELELKGEPRQYMTKEEYLKQKAEKEAFMMPSLKDDPYSKKA